jgi:hypothetical protein
LTFSFLFFFPNINFIGIFLHNKKKIKDFLQKKPNFRFKILQLVCVFDENLKWEKRKKYEINDNLEENQNEGVVHQRQNIINGVR